MKSQSFKIWVLLAFIIPSFTAEIFGAVQQSVTQFGITWTFDEPKEVGQFANGDWWVLGPVTIVKIDPKSENDMHGSMVNPKLNEALAFDRRMQNNTFEPELNVATQLPLLLDRPTSMLSSISLLEKSQHDDPQLSTIAILTILLDIPPEGSFRPPYQEDDKTILGNVKDINYDVLGKVKPVEVQRGAPKDLALIAQFFERPWIELRLSWTGRYTHPKENQPPYGREIASRLNDGLLALQLDFPVEEKRALMINLIQVGLDIYGAARLGGVWDADGGHNPGRKMPMILAGKALGLDEVLAYADGQAHHIFQEDQQTFYVTQAEVDLTNSPKWKPDKRRKNEPYTSEDIGMPEWGIRHSARPSSDCKNWDAMYRQINNAIIPGFVLTAQLMDAEEQWNHPALFDYADRLMSIDKGQTIHHGANSVPSWIVAMWEAYRKPSAAHKTDSKAGLDGKMVPESNDGDE